MKKKTDTLLIIDRGIPRTSEYAHKKINFVLSNVFLSFAYECSTIIDLFMLVISCVYIFCVDCTFFLAYVTCPLKRIWDLHNIQEQIDQIIFCASRPLT
jgi:hypothetical protein